MAKPPNADASARPASRRIRVAYATMLFPADSETFASQDVRELRRKGVEIEVHSLRLPNGNESALAVDRGIADVPRTYNSALATLRGLWAMVLRPRRSVAAASYIIRHSSATRAQLLRTIVLLPRAFDVVMSLLSDPPDVLHVYWGHYPALVGYLAYHFLPDTKVSMSLGAYDLEARYPLSQVVAQRAIFVRTHGWCNVPDLVEQVGVAPDRVAVIYNGVNLANLPPHPLEVKRVPGRIVTAARLVPSKGVDDVLTAFASICSKLPGATLEVFGDGTDRSRLEALAAELGVGEAVSFRGHVPHHDVFSALSKAELFLFLSRDPTDRLPNVVKEAMGCGAVCIVSETKGINELIADSVRGRVVAMGDPQSAAAAAISLLNDSAAADAMRAAAYDHLMKLFDLRRTTQTYIDLWTASLIKHARPSNDAGLAHERTPMQEVT